MCTPSWLEDRTRPPHTHTKAREQGPGGATEPADGVIVVGGEMVPGDESLMAPKAHGSSAAPVQARLRWDVSRETADQICSFNRHFAEHAGSWRRANKFVEEVARHGQTTYYDSVSGRPLFVAPIGRYHQRGSNPQSPDLPAIRVCSGSGD